MALTYRDAGVDIDAGEKLVERIKPLAEKTLRKEVLKGIGGFGALFEVPKRYHQPVLVSGADGVGTKLKLAFELDRHDSIGQDLVAMCVNDVIVQGAEPLFFLDYFSCGCLDVEIAADVVAGIAHGCELAGCALIGGETAEMPGMYASGEYDLAGFAVGVVEKNQVIDGRQIAPGDKLIGLASSGAHSNGYSLIRKIIEQQGIDLPTMLLPAGESLAELAMLPTRIYARSLQRLSEKIEVKGIAHITGGGLSENLPRMLPTGVAAMVDASSWPRPALFSWLQKAGRISDEEMYRVFNCGIGMALVVDSSDEQLALAELDNSGEICFPIGNIIKCHGGEAQVCIG